MQRPPDVVPAPQLHPRQRAEPLTQDVFDRLQKTRPWVQLAGYISLGSCILTLIGAFAVFFASDMESDAKSIIFLLQIFAACVYATPAIYLLRYGHAIGEAYRMPSSTTLAEALRMQLRYWRFFGLLLLIGVSLFVAALLTGVFLSLLWKMA